MEGVGVYGELPPGTLLQGKYELQRMLGKGGFGVTYLALDKSSNRKVAIKEYFPNTLSFRAPGSASLASYTGEKTAHFESGVEKFYSEAKLLSRFNGSEYIVGVMDFFRENNTAYYAMEYVDGVDLKKYLEMKGGRLPYSEVVDIAVPVMYALVIIHSMDILHRDISPDNIYLTREGGIKILDFGAARQVYGEQANMSVILKQGYAPVEQYRKQGRHGPWSDIYAFGATLYYLLTGIVPEDSINRVEADSLPMPSRLGVAVPPAFESILAKMMAVRAEDRYQSVIEVKEALQAMSASGATGDFPFAAEQPLQGRRKAEIWTKRRLAIIGGMLFSLILAAALLAMAISSGSEEKADSNRITVHVASGSEAAATPSVSETGKIESGETEPADPEGAPDSSASSAPPASETASLPTDALDEPWTYKTALFAFPGLYSGQWQNGAPNGKGRFVVSEDGVSGMYEWHEGDVYDGIFANGLLEGKGSYESPAGVSYDGDFQEGMFSGMGTYRDSRGDAFTYYGEFANDIYNGFGVMLWDSGEMYDGAFRNGNPHGEGALYDADGNEFFSGQWVDGQPQEQS